MILTKLINWLKKNGNIKKLVYKDIVTNFYRDNDLR